MQFHILAANDLENDLPIVLLIMCVKNIIYNHLDHWFGRVDLCHSFDNDVMHCTFYQSID